MYDVSGNDDDYGVLFIFIDGVYGIGFKSSIWCRAVNGRTISVKLDLTGSKNGHALTKFFKKNL